MKRLLASFFALFFLFSNVGATVITVKNVNEYMGLSSDSKPTGQPSGSRFYETDTGFTYIFNGSSWVLMISPVFSTMSSDWATAKITVTDSSQLLSTAFNAAHSGTDPDWTQVKEFWIGCEDKAVRISFGVAAGQGVSAMGPACEVGESGHWSGNGAANSAYIINKDNGQAGTLMVVVGW